MREIVARNITSRDRKKKDVLIFETFQEDGLVAKLQKRFLYFVQEVIEVEDPSEIDLLLEERTGSTKAQPPHRNIFRFHNAKEGKDIFLYKTIGDLYIVIGNKVFFIKLLHYTRMEFIRSKQINSLNTKTEVC